MVVATKKGDADAPVKIFLNESMTIARDARLSGDESENSWSRFLILSSPGGYCETPSISISTYFINPDTTSPALTSNLGNVFLWLRQGKMNYNYDKRTLKDKEYNHSSIPALVGSVCQLNPSSRTIPSSLATLSTLPNRKFFEGLGGAYGFKGLFGSEPPNKPPIQFLYRGFGFSEISTSL
jgi:hypothetical protein